MIFELTLMEFYVDQLPEHVDFNLHSVQQNKITVKREKSQQEIKFVQS